MSNPQCLPATNIQATLADLHGKADNITAPLVADNWTGATIVPTGGGPQTRTFTKANFAGSGFTATVTAQKAAGAIGGGAIFVHDGTVGPESTSFTLDLGAPHTNVTIALASFSSGAGEKLTAISPPATSGTGGALSAGNTVFTATGAPATSSGTIHFAGPVQFISFQVADTTASAVVGLGTISFNGITRTLNLALGTTSGGPYPTQVPVGGVLGNNTLNQPVDETVTGLAPNTTYFYRLEVRRSSDGLILESSAECSFTTAALPPPPPSVECTGATGVTDTSAQVNGIAHNADPLNDTRDFLYSTTPGGPYTNNVGEQGVSGGDPEPIGAPLAGLTPATQYYFVAVIIDETDVNNPSIIAQSAECSFTTLGSACGVATSVTTDSATLNGTLTGVQAGNQYRFRYGLVSGGPYGTVIGPFPAADGPVSQPTGAVLTPGTVYYFVVDLLDSGSNVLTTSSQCTFLTLSSAPVPTGQINCGHDVYSDWDCFTYTVDGQDVTQCYPPGVNDWNPLG